MNKNCMPLANMKTGLCKFWNYTFQITVELEKILLMVVLSLCNTSMSENSMFCYFT
jgi:hypothetical protein